MLTRLSDRFPIVYLLNVCFIYMLVCAGLTLNVAGALLHRGFDQRQVRRISPGFRRLLLIGYAS